MVGKRWSQRHTNSNIEQLILCFIRRRLAKFAFINMEDCLQVLIRTLAPATLCMNGTVLCCDGNLSRAKKTGRPQVLVVGTALLATSFSGPYETTFTTNLLAVKTNMIDVSILHSTCRVSVHGSRLQLGCFMFSMICSCSRYLSFKHSGN